VANQFIESKVLASLRIGRTQTRGPVRKRTIEHAKRALLQSFRDRVNMG
jgi:hypothetical protein